MPSSINEKCKACYEKAMKHMPQWQIHIMYDTAMTPTHMFTSNYAEFEFVLYKTTKFIRVWSLMITKLMIALS